jgi:hypothetical protein
MAYRGNIFAKVRLRPSQMRAVADRRFEDARCLLDSGNKQRANGAIYMAGFVVECLLKALLLERHPNLQNPLDPSELSKTDREAFDLIYRSHELDAMLVFLPEVEKKLSKVDTKTGRSAWREFQNICEEWTIYVRYSPLVAELDQAKRYLETMTEVKKWLKDL